MNLAKASELITPTIVVDCGANQGYWIKEAQTIWPDAYYFAVEANRECESALSFLDATYQIATLSDTVKTVTFYTLKDAGCATGASYYRENTNYFVGDKAVENTVTTRTLDGICAPIDFKDSTLLLKLDLQGAELDVLKGGPVVLSHADGVIIELSYSEYNQGAPLADEVDSWLYQHGFEQSAHLEDICHVDTREIIQKSWLYLPRP